MKKLAFLLLTILFVFSAAAQVTHQIEAEGEKARINTSIVLTCSEESTQTCPVNSWQLGWQIPDSAEVARITDSQGEIEDYSRNEDKLQIQTNRGPARKSEKIKIELKLDRNAEEPVAGLNTRRISLPGLPSNNTTGTVLNKDLVSASITEGFVNEFNGESMDFKGKGGLTIQLNSGEGMKEGEYTFFGGEVENSSLAYRVSVGTTGLTQRYPSIPVAVMEGEKYDSEASSWSEGEYSAGVVRVRETEDNSAHILAEETVHAFNDEALSFDKTSSSYIDEGIAGHTQSQVRKKILKERENILGENRVREIFGEDVTYTKRENGSLYRYTKPSNGERENLWRYYRNDMEFMKSWSPRDPDNRRFGYAYSELIVKNYISKNNTLKHFYRSLPSEKLENNKEKWRYYSDYVDLTPCDYESRERFDGCLERINSYDYPVYYAEEIPEQDSVDVQVQELNMPNSTSEGRFRNSQLFERGIVSSLIDFLDDLWAGL